MVDFTLTDEQQSMRELAHDFAEKEIRPVAWEYDRDGTWPQEIIEKAWELGLMNSHLPAEYGGPGLGYLDGCIIEEEIAWGCSGIGTSLSCNGLATMPISLAASDELKKEYLGRLVRGAAAGVLLSDRARCRLRRLGDEDHRRAPRRQVGHQRLQVLHHQRRVRQLLHRVREDRQGGRPSRDLLLHRPARRRRGRRQARGQDGSAGVQHRRRSRSTTSRSRSTIWSARRTRASRSR